MLMGANCATDKKLGDHTNQSFAALAARHSASVYINFF